MTDLAEVNAINAKLVARGFSSATIVQDETCRVGGSSSAKVLLWKRGNVFLYGDLSLKLFRAEVAIPNKLNQLDLFVIACHGGTWQTALLHLKCNISHVAQADFPDDF